MEELKNKQENVRDYLRENSELIERIDRMVEDDLRIVTGTISEPEKCECGISNEDKNILEQCISQNIKLKTIIKILEETRLKLIG